MHSRARLFLLPVFLIGMIGFVGCATGYRRRPLVDWQILQDLQNIKLEALQPSAVPEKVKPLASGASFDPAKGITVDEAVLVAEYLNPGIRAFRLQQGVAEGELGAPGSLKSERGRSAREY